MNEHDQTASAKAAPGSRLPGVLLRKRLFDLSIAVPLLVVFSPVMAVVFLAVTLALGRPALFRQVRPGLHGRPFTLVKFRSMTDARAADGRLKPDAERLPPLGRLLRRTSLDELPQLWNVLRGEMSLVGPRPLMMEYLPRYSPEQMRRHDVLPGITGWSQVNGRNNLAWEEKVALDVEYVDRCSLWLDIRILLRTVRAVTGAEGVSAPSHFSSPEFMGTAARERDGKETA